MVVTWWIVAFFAQCGFTGKYEMRNLLNTHAGSGNQTYNPWFFKIQSRNNSAMCPDIWSFGTTYEYLLQ